MNDDKCYYTVFTNRVDDSLKFDLRMQNELVPYDKNPIFLGIRLDEQFCFKKHLNELRVRALKRLNIVKIFSHQSWHLNHVTQIEIYRAILGSIFDYSFFMLSNLTEINKNKIQTVQNRAIRCIFKLPRQYPTNCLYPISNILTLDERFRELGERYIVKALIFNPEFARLVEEYASSISTITARNIRSSPLCGFLEGFVNIWNE